MRKLIKFNQRGQQVVRKTTHFSLGIIIKNIKNDKFSFDIVNDKKESISFINMNEWKIFSISSSPYFTREKISFAYSDPNGLKQVIKTGGRTINTDNANGLYDMSNLLQELLIHFHRISCFRDIESVIDKKEKLEKENRHFEAGLINPGYMSTSF